ncbi:hypothetical protein VUR80DRAFT_1815 [Thermomyces stellatus]
MRFTPVIVAGLMAVAKAQDTTTASDAAPTSGLSSEVEKCIKECRADDVQCIAHCAPVPSPDEGNLDALHNCVGDCDQGSGSESDTVAYGNCVSQCVLENYYDPDIGTPGQGQSGSGSNDSDDDSSDGDDSSSDDDSGDGSGDGDDSGDGDSGDGNSEGSEDDDSDDGGNAASGIIASPLMALFGVAAAVLAF